MIFYIDMASLRSFSMLPFLGILFSFSRQWSSSSGLLAFLCSESRIFTNSALSGILIFTNEQISFDSY